MLLRIRPIPRLWIMKGREKTLRRVDFETSLYLGQYRRQLPCNCVLLDLKEYFIPRDSGRMDFLRRSSWAGRWPYELLSSFPHQRNKTPQTMSSRAGEAVEKTSSHSRRPQIWSCASTTPHAQQTLMSHNSDNDRTNGYSPTSVNERWVTPVTCYFHHPSKEPHWFPQLAPRIPMHTPFIFTLIPSRLPPLTSSDQTPGRQPTAAGHPSQLCTPLRALLCTNQHKSLFSAFEYPVSVHQYSPFDIFCDQ